ncbi:hypothetical protein [Cellulomonas sp. URHD0024]|uniref:hypothetical protein n=1 Tax=Cellulomonas sp. URHD0024 TaxID=1302620 RepID=UPI000425EF46|nr:hypothetical protein [Cellulomonas sp. URHD0024]
MTAHEDDDWLDEEWDTQLSAGRSAWEALDWDDSGPDDDLPPPPRGAVRTPDDALAVLLGLVGPERSGEPALWFVMLDAEGCTLPVALPISDIPMRADPEVVGGVMRILGSVLDDYAPGGSVLVGLVREAGGDRGLFESSWAGSLREGADEAGVRLSGLAAIGADRARMLEW